MSIWAIVLVWHSHRATQACHLHLPCLRPLTNRVRHFLCSWGSCFYQCLVLFETNACSVCLTHLIQCRMSLSMFEFSDFIQPWLLCLSLEAIFFFLFSLLWHLQTRVPQKNTTCLIIAAHVERGTQVLDQPASAPPQLPDGTRLKQYDQTRLKSIHSMLATWSIEIIIKREKRERETDLKISDAGVAGTGASCFCWYRGWIAIFGYVCQVAGVTPGAKRHHCKF